MGTMDHTLHNEVTAGFWVQLTWLAKNGPDPVHWRDVEDWITRRDEARRERGAAESDLRQRGHTYQELVNDFNTRFGTPRRLRDASAQQRREPVSTWPGWYEARDMIAIALGAPEPRWINGVWWHDRQQCPLSSVNSAADVTRVKVPEWPKLEIVQRMLAGREQWQQECPGEPFGGFGIAHELAVPGRGPVPSVNYPAFVDLGVYLMGMTNFLTLLGGDRAAADALMDLCFELSTTYTEFLLSLKPEQFDALCGFGGDATCLLSPGLYERYGAGWDARLFGFARRTHGLSDEAPCNYHSCGPSGHLYAPWGQHPCHGNLTTIQTRLLPGEVGRLRANLPNTQLELTIHVPQLDLATVEPEVVQSVLWSSARDAGFHNLHFAAIVAVHQEDDLPRLERNLRACHETMEEIQQQSPSR